MLLFLLPILLSGCCFKEHIDNKYNIQRTRVINISDQHTPVNQDIIEISEYAQKKAIKTIHIGLVDQAIDPEDKPEYLKHLVIDNITKKNENSIGIKTDHSKSILSLMFGKKHYDHSIFYNSIYTEGLVTCPYKLSIYPDLKEGIEFFG